MRWTHEHRTLDITKHPAVVGILNVTPDSYFDGGKFVERDAIVARAKQIVDEGGDVIDIGGESTGPGSQDVTIDQEIARVIPAVEAIRSDLPDAWISVDTYKSEVARAAILAGADMINDITAGRGDEGMFSVMAMTKAPYVMMYAKDESPRTSKADKQYDDVVATIHAFLESRIAFAAKEGIDRAQIIVDPGLGHFVSSDPKYSWEILEKLRAFTYLAPVYVSPSRKSFLAGSGNLPPSERLPATLEATRIALKNGARFIRTHDVKETVEVRNGFTM